MQVTGASMDGRGVAPPDRQQLRAAVGDLMAIAFFQPILATARDTGLKGEVGHGGRGEQMFAAQLDEVLAVRLGASPRFDLPEAIVDRFSRSGGAEQEVTATAAENAGRLRSRVDAAGGYRGR